MSKFIMRGGYGEHGRSCFLVEYGQNGRMYMVDCGIMDTDVFPYPHVTREELEKVDYLFLTHCHKDHSGAFAYFVSLGFHGTLVASAMTVKLAGIAYEKTEFLKLENPDQNGMAFGTLTVCYGRSGHCPGALWFEIQDGKSRFLFSGDYQENTCFYRCDPIRGREAELAVIDCAHRETEADADLLRESLLHAATQKIKDGKQIIFPVPQFGRGLELYWMIQEYFPGIRICVDPDFRRCAETMISELEWFFEEPYKRWMSETLRVFEPEQENKRKSDFDILLIADTHLKKKENLDFVKAASEKGAAVFITGRVKKNGPVDQLLREGKAEKHLFPHHQSYGDLKKVMENNQFGVILPFHNDQMEILVSV